MDRKCENCIEMPTNTDRILNQVCREIQKPRFLRIKEVDEETAKAGSVPDPSKLKVRKPPVARESSHAQMPFCTTGSAHERNRRPGLAYRHLQTWL